MSQKWYIYIFLRQAKVRTCTGTEALYRPYGPQGSRDIELLFHDHGTRRGREVSVTPQPLFPLGKDPVPILQEAGWAPGPVCTGAENLAPTAIRSPDRPARSQSLYRLNFSKTTVTFSACQSASSSVIIPRACVIELL